MAKLPASKPKPDEQPEKAGMSLSGISESYKKHLLADKIVTILAKQLASATPEGFELKTEFHPPKSPEFAGLKPFTLIVLTSEKAAEKAGGAKEKREKKANFGGVWIPSGSLLLVVIEPVNKTDPAAEYKKHVISELSYERSRHHSTAVHETIHYLDDCAKKIPAVVENTDKYGYYRQSYFDQEHEVEARLHQVVVWYSRWIRDRIETMDTWPAFKCQGKQGANIFDAPTHLKQFFAQRLHTISFWHDISEPIRVEMVNKLRALHGPLVVRVIRGKNLPALRALLKDQYKAKRRGSYHKAGDLGYGPWKPIYESWASEMGKDPDYKKAFAATRTAGALPELQEINAKGAK